MEKLLERINVALGAIASGPRDLRAYLSQPGPDFEKASAGEVNAMIDMLLSQDPNDSPRLRFSDLLRTWDNTKEDKWTSGTQRNTPVRRKRINELLKVDAELEKRIDGMLPFFPLEEPLIISEEHAEWYAPKPGRDYYWTAYTRYLKERRGWRAESLLNMDNSTRAIVECLANPESKAAYSSRGLVMGYVQSGKTANFAGVVARAADAGYRLIIVLAGTWNILRNQTQRRLDKELLGKELLRNDDVYLEQPPSDWDEFLEHGFDPAERGHYTWQRLTRPDIDFRRLRAAIDNLEFEKREKARPIYDPSNLHALPVKLLVVKKNSTILANLVKDLKLIRTSITDLPALIIDDESDQAGLNTADPSQITAAGKERSKTNERIVELLRLFPRGQYVGYTATPYANALVDPDDPEDLFPKDFIISLDRPAGYMGVSDFFDPMVDFDALSKSDFAEPEIAFIRRVANPQGQDDDDLKMALRSYVLSGAVKLFRISQSPKDYKPEQFKHHTMLIHTSRLKGQHATLAERVRDLWSQCSFNSPKSLAELQMLWDTDYAKVCAAQGASEIKPGKFADLIPYLGETIKRIERGHHFVLVLNSDSSDAPDFSREPVWKILVGGNKLSRGYTIEGLTVSYYRRVSNTVDTLMQMGRWFGFRPGYRDLIRVYLGVREGKRADTDLVALFKEICRMEESFREEIKRYVNKAGGKRITPKQIPPLISVIGQLPPTARNKMFNAVLESKNFGGSWSTPTMVSAKDSGADNNSKQLSHLLSEGKAFGDLNLGGEFSKENIVVKSVWRAKVFKAINSELTNFLKEYRWLEDEFGKSNPTADVGLQIEFLENANHGIKSWVVIAPQSERPFGKNWVSLDKSVKLEVRNRERISGKSGRFKVFGEPRHRAVASFLAELKVVTPDKLHLRTANKVTGELRGKGQGVMLVYPVREDMNANISIGFELLFPDNSLPYDMNFTVRKRNEKEKIVV